MNKKILILVVVLIILIIGTTIMALFFKKEKIERVIEKTLLNIHSDLKKIKSDFPQLADVEKAKIRIEPSYYSYTYEKGYVGRPESHLTEPLIFEENGCRLVIEIDIISLERIRGLPPRPPMFGGTIDGKQLAGMVFIDAESTQQGESFKNKVKGIVYSRLKEMENELKVKINYDTNFFPDEARQIGLMQPFTLNLKESAIVKANEETSIKITLDNAVVERIVQPGSSAGEESAVSGTIIFEEGDFKEKIPFVISSSEVVKSVGSSDDPKGFNLKIINASADSNTIWLTVQLDRIGLE